MLVFFYFTMCWVHVHASLLLLQMYGVRVHASRLLLYYVWGPCCSINNGQSRETGNKEWTIQSDRQNRMDNPERQAIQNGQSRETGNKEWTIQRDRQSLWIVHYLLPVSMDCPFFIACLSGLSILYCLSLWIVHSLLPVSLDCPFFQRDRPMQRDRQ
jgi:hypothetical protein